jgi:alkaline phosphatase D
MDRRSFLKLGGFVTVSAATGTLFGCSSSDVSQGATPATGSDWSFPQSIASGDPKPDSIML